MNYLDLNFFSKNKMGSKCKLTFLVSKEVHKNILGGSSQENAKSAESVVLGI